MSAEDAAFKFRYILSSHYVGEVLAYYCYYYYYYCYYYLKIGPLI